MSSTLSWGAGAFWSRGRGFPPAACFSPITTPPSPTPAPCVCASRRPERENAPRRIDRGVTSRAQAFCRASAGRGRVARYPPALEALRQTVEAPRSAHRSAPGCPDHWRSSVEFLTLHHRSGGALRRIFSTSSSSLLSARGSHGDHRNGLGAQRPEDHCDRDFGPFTNCNEAAFVCCA